MKRLLSLLLLSTLLLAPLSAHKKVAVVLSGGGAKGMAHIGALKVIEQSGVPIDIVVGTSMGAIVGGLYAIGYSPEQLDSIVMSQDWRTLLSDMQDRKTQTLAMREETERYIFSIPFSGKPQEALSGGVIRGRNIGNMLWQLTRDYHDSIRFDQLPIPFACVSQDVATGAEIVHTQGILPIAMRASMSIPGVFAPIRLEDKLLVDGGIINNFPVDVARRMGADLVIGVDVQDTLKSAAELQKDLIGQLSQLIDLQSKDRWLKNIGNSDVYIKVDIKGYNTASFNTNAIDSLIDRGQQAATRRYNELLAVRERAGLTDTVPRRPSLTHLPTAPVPAVGNQQKKDLHILTGDAPQNTINLGARYDNEQLAALIFSSKFQISDWKRHSFYTALRLGKHTYGLIEYALHLGRAWHLSANYELSYNDFNINQRGERVYEISFLRHKGSVAFTKSWKKTSLSIGARYHNYDYGSFLYKFENSLAKDIHTESYFKFGGTYTFSSMDDAYFPTRGHELKAQYNYVVVATNHTQPFHAASIAWKATFSPHRRWTLQPRVSGRYITTENTVSEINAFGGQEPGKYFEQQMAFYGVNRFEVARRALIIGGLESRYRIGKRHFVGVAGNFGLTSDTWVHFFRNAFGNDEHRGFDLWGIALKYDLRTLIGPVGLTVHYSNRTRTVNGYIRAGFNF